MKLTDDHTITATTLFSSGTDLLDARTGRVRRGKIGTFTLGDLSATVEAAHQRLSQLRERVRQITGSQQDSLLISEAPLSEDELTVVYHASTLASGLAEGNAGRVVV